jgi:hypothetical protein
MIEVRATALRTPDRPAAASQPIPARIQNLSRGGLCILSSQPIPERGVFLCEMALPQLPVTVPALLRVCWTRQPATLGRDYLAGLQFLY